MKKTFIIAGIIVALIAIGGGAYLFFTRQADTGNSSGLQSFLGFGRSSPNTPQGDLGIDPSTNTVLSTDGTPVLKQLTTMPISGFAVDADSAGNTMVHYQERALGHVSQLFLPNTTPTTISSSTEPTIYQSFWGRGGSDVVMQWTGDSSTIKTATEHLSSGVHTALPDNISAFTVSPDKTKAFFLVKTPQGATGYTTTLDGKTQKSVFTSPLREWLVAWVNPTTLTFTTKPSARISGSISTMSTATFSPKIVLSGKTGLTGILSPDGKTIVYSESTPGGIQTNYYTLATGATSRAPFTTLPEKCVWSGVEKTAVYCAVPSSIPQGEYPDAWYMGTVSFFDTIWKFNTSDTSVYSGRIVINGNDGVHFDAINLTLDPSEHYLLFMNKVDGTLWSIDLTQAVGLD